MKQRLSRMVARLGGPIMAPGAVLGGFIALWFLLDFAGLAPWGLRAGSALVDVVSLAELDEVLARPGPPVVVDYWSTWCAPCRAFNQVFKRVAPEFAGRARFVKVEIADEDLAFERFGVSAIPSVFVYRGGRRVAVMRAADEGGLRAVVEEAENRGHIPISRSRNEGR